MNSFRMRCITCLMVILVARAVAVAEDLGVVRIEARVDDGRTIVSFQGVQIGRGIILTCGHCCRSAGGRGGRVTVGILSERTWKPYRSVDATVLCYDYEADCGLLQLDDREALATAYALAPRGTIAEPGDEVFAFRWRRDVGALAPLRGRITRMNPYLGPPVIETTTIPEPGESGGPLLHTRRREIIGITSAADQHLHRGIYCGLEPIYRLLDTCGPHESWNRLKR